MMQYRRFGRTGLQMPVFSCGGMRYQEKWQDAPPEEISAVSQENLEATIRRSLELGINHIETARGYGTSEMQLGRILPTLPRDGMIVQTKIGPTEDPKQFLETFEKSMAYLKLDYVDLLSLHGVNNADLMKMSLRKGGCLEAARSLQRQGRARFVGFSTHARADVILEGVNSGLFDYINLHWYYIYQFNWTAIEAASRQDMGVFIISPTDKGGQLFNPPRKLADLCAPLSPIVFNDLFCLSRPEVHTLSVGAARPGDFDEHLKTLPLLEKAGELLPPIVKRLEETMKKALGVEWSEKWHEGLPPFEDTPGNLNLFVILWLRNLALAYDMVEYGKFRYNLFGNGGHWFPGNRPGEIEDAALIEALARSPYREKIPAMIREAQGLFAGEEVKRLSKSD